jgi:hypothetical protein
MTACVKDRVEFLSGPVAAASTTKRDRCKGQQLAGRSNEKGSENKEPDDHPRKKSVRFGPVDIARHTATRSFRRILQSAPTTAASFL